jgi:hypothetical protein
MKVFLVLVNSFQSSRSGSSTPVQVERVEAGKEPTEAQLEISNDENLLL